MSYLDKTLTFESDKIYYYDEDYGDNLEVMMSWEDPLMSASAAYVCQNGGDILEIGFGMGISAGYIQSHSINSHTICENHPQIIPLALEWAEDKPNVTIVIKCFTFKYPFLILIVFTTHKYNTFVNFCIKHIIMCMSIST